MNKVEKAQRNHRKALSAWSLCTCSDAAHCEHAFRAHCASAELDAAIAANEAKWWRRLLRWKRLLQRTKQAGRAT